MAPLLRVIVPRSPVSRSVHPERWMVHVLPRDDSPASVVGVPFTPLNAVPAAAAPGPCGCSVEDRPDFIDFDLSLRFGRVTARRRGPFRAPSSV